MFRKAHYTPHLALAGPPHITLQKSTAKYHLLAVVLAATLEGHHLKCPVCCHPPSLQQAKETQRFEAAAGLERKMAAMQAVLAARRTIVAQPIVEVTPEAAAKAAVADLMRPMSVARGGVGAGCGNGHEILLQVSSWGSGGRGGGTAAVCQAHTAQGHVRLTSGKATSP